MLSIVEARDPDPAYSDLSTGELEKSLNEIEVELEGLSSMSLRSGVGNVGFRSRAYGESDHLETIEIDLEAEHAIDEIMLVPYIWRDSKRGFRGEGIPEEFRIVAGSDEDPEGVVIASYRKSDGISQGIAPLVIQCNGVKASWVRLEATVLSPRAWDGKYVLQLFEIKIFSGQENVALLKPVTTSTSDSFAGDARNKRFLVDGFVPYLMDAALGEQSLAYLSMLGVGEQPSILIDLGKSYPLNRIHLHATEISDTVPQGLLDGFGMPSELLVEGATQADFSDSVELVNIKIESIYETGPIVVRNFPEKTCRYVRLKALTPYSRIKNDISATQIGFAEIELFSNGKNVAIGAETIADLGTESPSRGLSALTDGRNLYGNILPMRDWLNELKKRHQLETERPLIIDALDVRYASQKRNLNLLGWLTTLLAVGLIIAILIGRMFRMRTIANIRLRLAADLHDELGANIHTIGLLSDLASETVDDPEELSTLHRRIRSETERSGMAVRHCTNMLEADGLFTDLKEDMARASRRIMAKLENDIVIEGEDYLKKLTQRARVDLYLFFKECLINITRHADASRFKTRLIADPKKILLTISDNGRGVDSAEDPIPKSLRRRSKLLGATVMVETSKGGGARINLSLPLRSWGYRKNINL